MGEDEKRLNRLTLFFVDDVASGALRDFRDTLLPLIDGFLDASRADVARAAVNAKGVGDGAAALPREDQKKHVLDYIFSGSLNDQYFSDALRIGEGYAAANVSPGWYLAFCSRLADKIVALALTTYRRQPEQAARVVAAINKVFHLDMDLVASAITEKKNGQHIAMIVKDHTQRIEHNVGAVLGVVSSVSTDLETTAQSMLSTAEEATRQATSVGTAANQALDNVRLVASATEELTVSIHEIGRQASQSTEIANSAVEEVHRTNKLVQGLSEAAGKIGDIVKLINQIAGQTNLLALNATIEAARAGEAGKGFAVVAGEVKTLAHQTATATGQISTQVAAVQGATKEAVDAIRDIAATIDKFNQITSSIASAVEEQGIATSEIAEGLLQASADTEVVTTNIGLVEQAADHTGAAAKKVLAAVEALVARASQLSASGSPANEDR